MMAESSPPRPPAAIATGDRVVDDASAGVMLSIDSLRRIEEICTQFEASPPDQRRDLRAYLPDTDGPERAALMAELIALDVELRRNCGESPSERDYQSLLLENDPDAASIASGFLQGNLWQLLDNPDPESGTNAEPPTSHRYRFLKPIGSGGIGDVWRVWDTRAQRTLAIKVLRRRHHDDPAAQRRLHREALLTGSLQHPGVPPVYDHGQLDDGTHFFSMKLVDGETLATLLNRRDQGEDCLGERLGVFEQVAQALAYAHTEGVVHRDLKAQNVMVGRFGEVQLMDWGLAKRLDDTPTQPPRPPTDPSPGSPVELAGNDMTQAGDVMGTPNCMAPEQARGEIERIDRRTDVFGLAAMLYQILTGRPIYEGDSRDDVLAKSIRGDLGDAYRELDRLVGQTKLVELCRQCLRHDPVDRLADAGQVAAAVAEYRAGLERQVRLGEIDRARSETRHQEQRKRQRVVLASTIGLTAVAVLGSLGIGWQWKRATRLATAEAQARRETQIEAATVAQVNDFLFAILESPLPEKRGYDVTLREVIDASLPGLDERFTDRPGVEGQIRRTIGETYRWLGDADESERQYRAALRAFRRQGPPDEDEIVDTMDRLAGVLRSRGSPQDLAEALTLRETVMRHRVETLGESDRDTISAMNNLGVVLLDLDQPDRAAELFERAIHLAGAERATELADPLMMTLNLASARQQQGEFEAAEQGYRAVIGRTANDSTHPARMNAQTLLGEMITEQGRYDEAIEHLRDAFTAREDHYGPEHPLTLSSMRKLSRTFNAAQRWGDAYELLGETLRRHQTAFHPGSSTIFGVRRDLAVALEGLGRSEEAEAIRRETVEILRKHRGPEHRYTRQAVDDLAADVDRQ